MTPHKTSPTEDLKPVIDTLFSGEGETKPNILWSLHFTMNEYQIASGLLPPNVFSSPGPNSSLDFDNYVIEVFKKKFKVIFCAF